MLLVEVMLNMNLHNLEFFMNANYMLMLGCLFLVLVIFKEIVHLVKCIIIKKPRFFLIKYDHIGYWIVRILFFISILYGHIVDRQLGLHINIDNRAYTTFFILLFIWYVLGIDYVFIFSNKIVTKNGNIASCNVSYILSGNYIHIYINNKYAFKLFICKAKNKKIELFMSQNYLVYNKNC